MERKLKQYIRTIEALPTDLSPENGQALLRQMRVQIAFFQHERLIHLLVTLAFALFLLLSFFAALFLAVPALFALSLAFLLLLLPYIRHYYILENGVQRLYGLYDELVERTSQSAAYPLE